jgi:hypothetical protein
MTITDDLAVVREGHQHADCDAYTCTCAFGPALDRVERRCFGYREAWSDVALNLGLPPDYTADDLAPAVAALTARLAWWDEWENTLNARLADTRAKLNEAERLLRIAVPLMHDPESDSAFDRDVRAYLASQGEASVQHGCREVSAEVLASQGETR